MRKFFSEKLHISEDAAKWIGRALGVIIVVYVLGMGFSWGNPDNDPFNVGNLYEAIHPLKLHDIIGLSLFTLGTAWVTGIIEMFIGEIYQPEGSVWANVVGFVAAAGGILLCWA